MRPFSFIKSGASVFNPATLALTGWWRASYAGSPWAGTASAGTSGTVSLSEGTNPPGTGSAVGGFTPADFDGTNDVLGNATVSLDDFYNASSYSGWCLVNIDAISTDDGNVYDNDCIACTQPSAYWLLYLRSSGVVGIRHVSSSGTVTPSIAVSTGTWVLIQWKFDGSTLKLRTNGGSWQATSAGAIDSGGMSSLLKFGTNYTGGGKFFNGKMLEVALSDQVLSDANFDSVLGYARSRYALALT